MTRFGESTVYILDGNARFGKCWNLTKCLKTEGVRPSNCYLLQGYLAHKKQRHPRTLQLALGTMMVLGRGAADYERGSPVQHVLPFRSYWASEGLRV